MGVQQNAPATRSYEAPVPTTNPRTGLILTIDELAGYLKIPKSTLYKLAQEGKIPSQKVGRHWRFHRDAIDAWLQRYPNQALNSFPPGGDRK